MEELESGNKLVVNFWMEVYIANIKNGHNYDQSKTAANVAVEHLTEEMSIGCLPPLHLTDYRSIR